MKQCGCGCGNEVTSNEYNYLKGHIGKGRDHDPAPDGFRTCRGCTEVKAEAEFYRRKGYLDRRCKSCTKLQNGEWRDANRDAFRATQRAWAMANPDNAVKRQAVRRARKKGAYIEDVDPVAVYIMSYGLCGICGNPVDPLRMHVDHTVPLAKGGEHSYRNCQAAHEDCNQRKSANIQTVTPLPPAREVSIP